MFVNKAALILFSGFLIFATAPQTSAQSTAPNQDQTTKKQTTASKGSASKDEIMKAQQALKDKGMYMGAVDGMMNADTQKALRDYQQKNNLKASGTLDTETMASLGLSSERQSSTKASRSESKPSGAEAKPAKKGAKPKDSSQYSGNKTSQYSKDEVRKSQSALKQAGFDPGAIDGIMGPMTMTALRNYQSENGLQVSGNLDSQTQSSLMGNASAGRNRQSSLQTDQTQSNKPEPSQTYNSQSSSVGATSQGTVSSMEDVRQIQQSLADLGYLAPGEVNGMMSSQTQQAIRGFQWMNNMPVTGSIDEQTKIAINSQDQPGVQSAQLGKTESTSDLSTADRREKPSVAESTQSSSTQTQRDTTATETTKDTTKEKKHHEKSAKEEHGSTGKMDKDAAERASKAAIVLQDLTNASDNKIPNGMLERAEAIAVIPNVVKGAIGIGGRFGKGLVSERMESGRWSAPAYLTIGGGSFGLQLGVSSTDLVLVFTDRKALDLLEGGKDMKLGADVGVVAGPIGRSAEAGVNANLKSAVYAYSRAKGLFAGVALDGAVLSIDKDMNRKVYGSSVDAQQIFNGQVATNATGRPFVDTLEKVVPRKRISQK